MKRVSWLLGVAVLILFAGSVLAMADYGDIPILYGITRVQGVASIVVDATVGEGITTTAASWDEGQYPEGFFVLVTDVLPESNLRARLLEQGHLVDLTRLVDPLIADMLATELQERFSGENAGTIIPDLAVMFEIDGVVAVVDERFVFEGTVYVEIDGPGFFVQRERNLQLEPLLFGIHCKDLKNCEWSWYRCVKPGGGDCGVFKAFGICYRGVCEYHLFRGGCVCCPGREMPCP